MDPVVWIWSAPWIAFVLHLAVRLRLPRVLPPVADSGDAPSVSVVIPARNEERNIARCVESVGRATYPTFETIVVDDRSADGTASTARAAEPGNASPFRVIDGETLPDGWLGKPWACHQGARLAEGDLLLFTDADTIHEPELLARAVAALREDGADVVTLVGRQLVESFWERLIQPQIFLAMAARFPNQRFPLPPSRWRHAIANGQFILFKREAYERIGGHEAVKGEVVEDLRLAQLLVENGHTLSMRRAEDSFATRMYQSLSELVEGWSKNLAIASRMTVRGWRKPFALPLATIVGTALWVVPPVLAVLGPLGFVSADLSRWAMVVTGLSVLGWMTITARFGAPFWYGFLYPVGASAMVLILLRSWIRGRRVEWKGREYRIEEP